jgi:drug/metabolite transporter (DMT)-like permease
MPAYNRGVTTPSTATTPAAAVSPVPRRWRRVAGSPYLLLSLTSFFWALNWVLARDVRHEIGPNATALGRWVVALLIILPLAWQHLKRDWPEIKRDARLLTLLSLIGAGGYNALSYAGVKSTTALNAILLNATVPFFIMGLSWLFLKERLTLRQTLGLMMSCAGALWIIAGGDFGRLAALQFNHGDLLVLCAMLSWATYTIIVKRHPITIHLLSFVAVLSVTAVAMLIPLTVIESFSQVPQLSPKVIAVFVYMGIGPSLLCYVFWNQGIAAIGAARTGLFLYLVPVFGSVLSSLILGEHLALFHVAGFALVLAGLLVSNRSNGGKVG